MISLTIMDGFTRADDLIECAVPDGQAILHDQAFRFCRNRYVIGLVSSAMMRGNRTASSRSP